MAQRSVELRVPRGRRPESLEDVGRLLAGRAVSQTEEETARVRGARGGEQEVGGQQTAGDVIPAGGVVTSYKGEGRLVTSYVGEGGAVGDVIPG